MTGGAVFDESLRALAPFGRLVTYGLASRVAPTPITSGELMAKSRAVIGFWLAHCFARPDMLRTAMDDLLARLADGTCAPSRAASSPSSRPTARTRSCCPGARPASSCSTPA